MSDRMIGKYCRDNMPKRNSFTTTTHRMFVKYRKVSRQSDSIGFRMEYKYFEKFYPKMRYFQSYLRRNNHSERRQYSRNSFTKQSRQVSAEFQLCLGGSRAAWLQNRPRTQRVWSWTSRILYIWLPGGSRRSNKELASNQKMVRFQGSRSNQVFRRETVHRVQVKVYQNLKFLTIMIYWWI